MANSTFTYSEETLQLNERSEAGLQRVTEDLVDLTNQVTDVADELATVLRMNRDGELNEQQLTSQMYRVLYKLNEMVDEVENDYKLD